MLRGDAIFMMPGILNSDEAVSIYQKASSAAFAEVPMKLAMITKFDERFSKLII